MDQLKTENHIQFFCAKLRRIRKLCSIACCTGGRGHENLCWALLRNTFDICCWKDENNRYFTEVLKPLSLLLCKINCNVIINFKWSIKISWMKNKKEKNLLWAKEGVNCQRDITLILRETKDPRPSFWFNGFTLRFHNITLKIKSLQF